MSIILQRSIINISASNVFLNSGGTLSSISMTFAKFNNMWSAVVEGDWKRMAVEMEDSRWFGQVGRRSKELQEQVLSV